MHPNLMEVIHRAGVRGGMGLISRPDYWLGCPAEVLTGKKLFILWQEIALLEQCEELPAGASDHFEEWLFQMRILRPAHFFSTFNRWCAEGYGPCEVFPENVVVPISNPDVGFLGAVASTRRNDAMEIDVSVRARLEFLRYKDAALNGTVVHNLRTHNFH